MVSLQEVDPERWAPLFDPSSFNEENQPLTLEQYQMREEELRAWAQRCVVLRAAIVRRSQEYAPPEPDAGANEGPAWSRKGRKNSRRG